MFKRVYSGGLFGIDGYLVQVEADVSDGLPGFYMVGYLASEVREAEQRVRIAMKNSGFQTGAKKITINLSPGNIRKEGTAYDLPVAVAVMAAMGLFDSQILEESAFIGELGLDGLCKPVKGVLPLVLAFREKGLKRCFVSSENVKEALCVTGIQIIKVRGLKDLFRMLQDPEKIEGELSVPVLPNAVEEGRYDVDFSDIQGQILAKRATEIAVAGMHNILYIGPPGCGKSMMARRIPTIMPSMEEREQLEVSKIYSICGMLPSDGKWMKNRPYRSPHHTISPQGLAGGGMIPRPGEISLASRGVLFLDELPEFQRNTLEILRQPMEEQRITISRLHGSYEFPAHFMLAAAQNPCPCGYYPDRNRCSCTEWQIKRYLKKISRPLLDRIDVFVEMAFVTYQEMKGEGQGETSELIRKRVEQAREIQKTRFADTDIFFNSQMREKEIRKFCSLEKEDEEFLQKIFDDRGLTARGCRRILKVARTIADLEGKKQIEKSHLCEAISYRDPEERYWGGEPV